MLLAGYALKDHDELGTFVVTSSLGKERCVMLRAG